MDWEYILFAAQDELNLHNQLCAGRKRPYNWTKGQNKGRANASLCVLEFCVLLCCEIDSNFLKLRTIGARRGNLCELCIVVARLLRFS
jgi:hypothetical protein